MRLRSCWLGILAVVAVALVGLVPVGPARAADRPAPRTGHVVTGSLAWDGITRTYRIYVPSTYDSGTPTPLVFGLHGGFGSGAQFESANRFDAGAEAHGMIAVYPDGVPGPVNGVRTWNAGDCCGYAQSARVDDVGFIGALLASIESSYNIDPARIYAAGHSNGAMMSYRLACRIPAIAAIGVVEGAIDDTHHCDPAHALSVLIIHGRLDRNVPYAGGVGEGFSGVDYASVTQAVNRWRRLNHCDEPSRVTTHGDVQTTVAQGCDAGGAVRLRALADGNHEWPGGVDRAFISGSPSNALDATRDALDFLARHRHAS